MTHPETPVHRSATPDRRENNALRGDSMDGPDGEEDLLPSSQAVADQADPYPVPPVPESIPADAQRTPTELPLNMIIPDDPRHSVDRHRNLYCKSYDQCLDDAVDEGWSSFTCTKCIFYHKGRPADGELSLGRFATQRRGY